MDIATLGLRVDGSGAIRTLDDFDRSASRASKSGASAERVARDLRNALAALGVGLGVRELSQYADGWNLVRARIGLVTKSHTEAAAVMSRVFAIAQSSRQSLGATADLYTKMARSANQLGVSQADVLQVTEAVAKAMTVSGASTAEAEASIRQLGQAMASGALRGDELNAILEQSPRLAQAIADGMGVTVGALRKLGSEGKLTSREVFDAIQAQSAAIEAEFARMPVTIGQSFTVMQNELQRFVGGVDEASGASAVLSHGIIVLSRNLNHLVTVLGVAATIFAGRWVSAHVAGIHKAIVAHAQLTTAATLSGRAMMTAAGAAKALWAGIGGWVGAAVIALGALATAFAKVEEVERRAAGAARDFRASLFELTETQLHASLAQIETQIWEIERAMKSVPRTVQQTAGVNMATGGAVTVTAANPEFARMNEELTALGLNAEAVREALERFRETTTTVATVSEDAAKKIREQRAANEDMVREAKQQVAIARLQGAEQESMAIQFDAANKVIDARRRLSGDLLNETLAAISAEKTYKLEVIEIREEVERLFKVLEKGRDSGLISFGGQMMSAAEAMRHQKRGQFGVYETPGGESRSSVLEGITYRSVRGRIATSESEPPSWRMRGGAAWGFLRQGDISGAAGAMGIGGAGKTLEGLAAGAMKLLSVFNPLALISTVLHTSLEAVTPALESLRPAVEIVAKILGHALAPLLEALFPVFKMVAIAATYLGQALFNVAGGIAKALGWLIEAIGTVVDKLLPGKQDGLQKIGQGLQNLGDGFIETASALGDARDEIKAIEWGQKTEAELKKEAERAAELERERRALEDNLAVRELHARGLNAEAEELAFIIGQQQELQQALEKWGETNPELVLQVGELLEAEREYRIEQRRLAELAFREDLAVRRLRALGMAQEAEDLALLVSQRRELADARRSGVSDGAIADLESVHYLERLALEAERARAAREAEIARLERELQAVRGGIEAQIATVREAAKAADARLQAEAELIREQTRTMDRALQSQADAIRQAADQAERDFRSQIEVLRSSARMEDQALSDQAQQVERQQRVLEYYLSQQLELAQQDLGVARDQLREAERGAEQTRRVVASLREYLGGLSLDPALSTLSPEQRFGEAEQQFAMLFAQALAGNQEAASQLPQAAQELLEAARVMFASSPAYVDVFHRVRDSLEQVAVSYQDMVTAEERREALLNEQVLHLESVVSGIELAREKAEEHATRLALGLETVHGGITRMSEEQIAAMSEQLMALREQRAVIEIQREQARASSEAQIASVEAAREAAKLDADRQLEQVATQRAELTAQSESQLAAIELMRESIRVDADRQVEVLSQQLAAAEKGYHDQIQNVRDMTSQAERTLQHEQAKLRAQLQAESGHIVGNAHGDAYFVANHIARQLQAESHFLANRLRDDMNGVSGAVGGVADRIREMNSILEGIREKVGQPPVVTVHPPPIDINPWQLPPFDFGGLFPGGQLIGGIPGFADGGLHTGGLRLVGERGPELEITGPSRIVSNQQLGDMLSGNNQETVVELREQTRELKALVRLQAAANQELMDRLDQVVEGQEDLLRVAGRAQEVA